VARKPLYYDDISGSGGVERERLTAALTNALPVLPDRTVPKSLLGSPAAEISSSSSAWTGDRHVLLSSRVGGAGVN